MSELRKPIPIPDGDSSPFWNGCKEEKLLIQKCNDCDKYIFYPRIVCPQCMSDNIQWIETCGKGKVYSYTVVRRSAPAFSEDLPYVVALIELEEGVRMISNLVHCNIDEIYCDMPVEVEFIKREDMTLPLFKPSLQDKDQ